MTVPFLRNLRRARPDAWITWVVAPGSAEVVKGIPYVDELLFWDPVTIHADSRGTHRTLKSRLDFVRELRRRKFDTAYVLKRSFSSAIMALLSGARRRIGFNTEGRGFLLTKRIPYHLDRHEVLSFLDVLRADGIEPTDDHLEAWIDAAEDQEARSLMGAGPGFLAIHPFASSGVKSWPLERFAEVAHTANKLYGLVPVVLGGSRDLEAANGVSRAFPRRYVEPNGRMRPPGDYGGSGPLCGIYRKRQRHHASCLSRRDSAGRRFWSHFPGSFWPLGR